MDENIEKPAIRIGTSGYSYDDWIGPVYPKGIKKSEMLEYYATELKFNSVELNYTYYAMPQAKGIETMVEQTGGDFKFVVKAHSSITHRIRDNEGRFIRDESAVEAFLSGIAPMVESRRLISVLAQFPVKFSRTQGATEHLKWLVSKICPIVPLAVELRNKSWVAQSVFEFLKSIGASYCIVDEPAVRKLAPFTPVATADLAYFRFHGRNTGWFDVSAHQRYNYLYSDQELRQFLAPVKKISSVCGETAMFFNNHFQGSAVTNANQMKELLGYT